MSETYENEHILIDMIQHYPFLYNKSLKDYKDAGKRTNAWNALAAALSTTEENVQRLWKLLRERYTKQRRLQKNVPSGSGGQSENVWPLFNFMGFMEKHISTRKRHSNVTPTPSVTPIPVRPLSLKNAPAIPANPNLPPTRWPPMAPAARANLWNSLDEIIVEAEVHSEPENVSGPEDMDYDMYDIPSPTPTTPMTGNKRRASPSATPEATPSSSSGGAKVTPTSKGLATPFLRVAQEPATPSTSSGAQGGPPKKVRKAVAVDSNKKVEDHLDVLTDYLKKKKQATLNGPFCKFLCMSLDDMPEEEQAFKRAQLFEIINKPFTNK